MRKIFSHWRLESVYELSILVHWIFYQYGTDCKDIYLEHLPPHNGWTISKIPDKKYYADTKYIHGALVVSNYYLTLVVSNYYLTLVVSNYYLTLVVSNYYLTLVVSNYYLTLVVSNYYLTLVVSSYYLTLVVSNYYLTLVVSNYYLTLVVSNYYLTLVVSNYYLTLSLPQAIIIGFANSIDPDETAHMSRLIWIYAV